MYLLRLLRPGSPPLLLLQHSYPPSISAASAATSLAPARLIPYCSHHHIPTRSPGALSDPSHRSNIDCVAIYCATVLWSHLVYSSIVKNPVSSRAVAAEVYIHLPSVVLHMSLPVIRLATWA